MSIVTQHLYRDLTSIRGIDKALDGRDVLKKIWMISLILINPDDTTNSD